MRKLGAFVTAAMLAMALMVSIHARYDLVGAQAASFRTPAAEILHVHASQQLVMDAALDHPTLDLVPFELPRTRV